MNSLPQAPESVNPDETGFSINNAKTPLEPEASYYGILPAPVRYCKSIPPAAKLLFTEITALCSVKGYCWASNAHFAALYDVQVRSVQRWLSDLSQAGFIRIELHLDPTSRRIYDLTTHPRQKRHGGVSKKTSPHDEKDTHSIKCIKKENNKLLGPAYNSGRFVGPGPLPARELLGQEQKGSASPPSPSTLRAVERAVSLTRHLESRERFKALWEEVHALGCPEVWKQAVDVLKSFPSGNSTPSGMADLFISEVRELRANWEHERAAGGSAEA